jgi:hypothetical protein
MTLHISPYLQSHLQLADSLPDQLPDVPAAVVQALQARIRKLVEYVAARDEEIRILTDELERAREWEHV